MKTGYKVIDPIAVLKAALHTVRHHKLGWLRDDLLLDGTLDGSKDALHQKYFADYQAQQIHIRAMKEILGPDYNPLHVLPGRNEEGKFSFTKNVDVPKNHLSIAYLLHAYDVSGSTFKRLRLRNGKSLQKQVPHNKGQSVLDNADYAKTQYTPRYFYVAKQMKMWCKQNAQASQSRKATQRKKIRGMWDTEKAKDDKFGAAYEKKSRDHVVRQTGAKDEIVEQLNRNGRRSYSSLEKAINSWCSYKTIERYLKTVEDYHTYSQNVRPLLSEGNRMKQVDFSKHVRQRWGLPPGTKILWTMR
jgi:hypothetical protein